MARPRRSTGIRINARRRNAACASSADASETAPFSVLHLVPDDAREAEERVDVSPAAPRLQIELVVRVEIDDGVQLAPPPHAEGSEQLERLLRLHVSVGGSELYLRPLGAWKPQER